MSEQEGEAEEAPEEAPEAAFRPRWHSLKLNKHPEKYGSMEKTKVTSTVFTPPKFLLATLLRKSGGIFTKRTVIYTAGCHTAETPCLLTYWALDAKGVSPTVIIGISLSAIANETNAASAQRNSSLHDLIRRRSAQVVR